MSEPNASLLAGQESELERLRLQSVYGSGLVRVTRADSPTAKADCR